MSEIKRTKEYPELKEKHLTRDDIIQGNINMLDSGARECRRIGELASAEEKEIIAEILRAELEREKNPMTCDGCKWEFNRSLGSADMCYNCNRMRKKDRYEPKGEKA